MKSVIARFASREYQAKAEIDKIPGVPRQVYGKVIATRRDLSLALQEINHYNQRNPV